MFLFELNPNHLPPNRVVPRNTQLIDRWEGRRLVAPGEEPPGDASATCLFQWAGRGPGLLRGGLSSGGAAAPFSCLCPCPEGLLVARGHAVPGQREKGTAPDVPAETEPLRAAVVLRSQEPQLAAEGRVLYVALSAESGQSSGQFQGRPSEVWSQWQSQHHGQQSGEQHSHQQPGQTEVFQVNPASTTS